MENVQSIAGAYFNGDGFASERGVYDVRFIDTVARGNTDGGYDLKSSGTVVVRALSEENGRNYRLWGEATLIDSVGLNPVLRGDRKSTRSELQSLMRTSYAVFCLKKKKHSYTQVAKTT